MPGNCTTRCLQSFQGVILKFHVAAKQIPESRAGPAGYGECARPRRRGPGGGTRARSESARHDNIAQRLAGGFQAYREGEPPRPRDDLQDDCRRPPRELQPMVLEEVLSIGREALVNALRHSECLHTEVEITYDPRQFRLRIRDDGRGIDSRMLEEGGRRGHWGLPGMRERAHRIGARLELWSRPGSGTEVQLIVPGTTAYRALRAKSKRSWFRRPSGIDL